MPEGRKIATCCYCGTRAVLVFDKARHELTCQACGAPLHDMKFMPKDTGGKEKKKSRRAPGGAIPTYPRDYPDERPAAHRRGWPAEDRRPRKAPKRRKPFMRRMLEELWDEVEDIFD